MTKKKIAIKLRKLKRKGKSNEDIAKALGITERYVWGMLREEYDTISSSLKKLIHLVCKFNDID